jgi:hypothetical protein
MVVKTEGKTLFVRQDNVVVPVQVNHATELGSSHHKLSDFRPGQRVRVAVQVQDGTRNIARTVQPDGEEREGIGGGAAPPEVEPSEPPQPLEPGSAMGGSGVMNYGAEKNDAPNAPPPPPESRPPGEEP